MRVEVDLHRYHVDDFFFFIFIILYLGLVEVGERTYINGPPNPPLNLPAHSVLHYIITMNCKTRKMEKLLIRSRRTFMMGWLQRRWISKNNYPKGDSITEQNVAGWWTIYLSKAQVFFFFFLFCFVFVFVLFCVFNLKTKNKNRTKQKQKQIKTKKKKPVLFWFVFVFVLFCVFNLKTKNKNKTKQKTG